MPPSGFSKSVIRYKVEQILSPEHWAEYQRLLKDRRSTVRSLHAWLQGRGYSIGHMAVARHRRRFDADVESVRRTAMLAEQLAEAAQGSGGGGPAGAGALGASSLADATLARFQQVLLERLLDLDKDPDPKARTTRDFSPREWLELSKAVAESVSAKRNLEALRREYEDRARKAAEAVEKAAADSKTKDKPYDGVELSNTVRRLFCVPLPGEPLPRGTGRPDRPALPAPAGQPDSPEAGPDPLLLRVDEALRKAREN